MEIASLIVSLVSLAISLYVASYLQRKYGDVAGVLLDWEFQKKETRGARVAALQSLRNEVARIRKLGQYYSEKFGTGEIPTPKMPVAAFETAFVSGSPSLSAGEELVDAVCDYLVRADSVNSVIDRWLGRGGRAADVKSACNPHSEPPLSEILNRLDDCLKRELEA